MLINNELNEHNKRVGTLAYEFAKIIKLDNEYCKSIKIAGDNHDIGKIFIPRSIIDKPGKLTDKEFEIIKKHSLYSYEILKMKKFDNQICNMVKYHHENFNGTGYPEGLKGVFIPIGSRILKICDCFDALTNDRVYRGKLNFTESIKIMEDESIKYDPYFFEIFRDNYLYMVDNVKSKDRILLTAK